MKKRLLDLEVRCVLTRKEDYHRLDIKHVEHIKYDCNHGDGPSACRKEYVYGQLIVDEGILYYSQECLENEGVMQVPVVSAIYNSLSSEGMLTAQNDAKKVDDNNIDYVVDAILEVCPPVSQSYIDIMSKYGVTGDSTPGK
jgi:hypothetical protein